MTDAIQWGEGKKDRFIRWIDHELINTMAARQALERQWREWLIQYRPAAKQPLKQFPFEGASSAVMPLTAIDVDQLYASFMQTLHASDDLWSVSAFNEKWEPAAKPLQDFLTFLDKSVLKMYQVNKRVILEMVKMGTGVYKHGWHFEDRPVHRYDDKGVWKKAQKRVSRPFVDHVPLADFIIPPTAIEHQPDVPGGAPWIAHRIRMPVEKFRSMANSWVPLYPDVAQTDIDKILLYEELTPTEQQRQVQDLDYTRRAWGGTPAQFDRDVGVLSTRTPGGAYTNVRDVELFEVHARFACQGDSEDDIIVWYHRPTMTILRPILNPYHHGQRPFEVIRYFPGDGFYGIGVCEQKEIFQTMISDLFNFQHDNVMLANSRMIVAREGSNIAPGEPIFPGAVKIVTGNVNEDFKAWQMGEIYPSLPQLIQFVQAVGERRTSVSDLQLGNLQSLPSRTPASTVQNLLAEGKRRPDLTIRDMRYSGLGVLGLRMIQYLQQYATSPQDIDGEQWLQIAVDTLGLPEGQLVAEKLATPAESAEMGLGVSINAVSGTANKELEKQNLQGLLALHAQLAPQFLQLVQTGIQMQGNPIGGIALDLAEGQSKLYRRLLENYDFRDPDAIAPEIPPTQGGPGAPPLGPGPGPDPNALGGGPAPGMEALPQGAGMGMGGGM